MAGEVMKQEIKEVLDRLRDEGNLTASGVVEESKRKDSPLRTRIDWNDASAAEQWRLEQARRLIREYTVEVKLRPRQRVVFEATTVSVPKFVNLDHLKSKGESEYVPRAEVLSNVNRRREMVNMLLSSIEAILINNADVKELDPIVDAVAEVRKRWKLERVQPNASAS